MRHYFILLLSLFTITVSSQNVNADVFEINHQASLYSKNLFKYKDKILFAGDDFYGYNYHLWVYNYTTKKSQLLRTISSGGNSAFSGSSPRFLELNDKVYFLADNTSKSVMELWVTDATSNGTQKVYEFPQRWVVEFKKLENKLFISTLSGLVVSDGTTAGSRVISEIGSVEVTPGADYFDGYMIFGAKTGNYSNQLWATNGTETFRILDEATDEVLYVFTESFAYNLRGNFIFYGRNAVGTKGGLWKFDFATKKAKLITENSSFAGGVLVNDKLVYKAANSQNYGTLWSTDGTAENTIALNNQNYFVTTMTNQNFVMKNGNFAYFFPTIQNRNVLWRTDGTVEGTKPTNIVMNDYAPDLLYQLPLNKNLVIRTAGDEKRWLLDENEILTPLYQNLNDGAEMPGKIIFPYNNTKNGNELFQFDFATKSVELFHDGNHSTGSNPKNFRINDKLIFTANDYEHGNTFYTLNNKTDQPKRIEAINSFVDGTLIKVGNFYYLKPNATTNSIAKTDGSEEKTDVVYIPNPDKIDEYSSFGNLNDQSLIFTTRNYDQLKIWKTDTDSYMATTIKTISVSSNLPSTTETINYNGYLYFVVTTPDYKTQIWRTDGTAENTTLAPFTIPTSFNNDIPVFLTIFENKLLISMDYRLWSYDSATNDVKQITIPTDFQYGLPISSSKKPEVIDGKLYLLSQSGYGTVYKFNNLQDPPIAIVSDNMMGYFSEFQKCGNKIYFATGNNENRYNAFWSLDPVNNSGSLIFMNDYSGTNRVKNLACAKNYMYFSRENGNMLFRTSGTQQSITPIDITIDNADQLVSSDSVDNIFLFDGDLYTVLKTVESGQELFHIKTDLPTYLAVENVEYNKDSKIIISPNPTSGLIKIYAKSNINKVEIYDYSGIKISESQTDNLDFSKLNSGVYLVKIYTNDSVETKKVIKK